jgi:hypothetical protein
VRLEELLEQNQKTITETTGLLKRLHELSISIAEKQQEQLEGQRRQLDAVVAWQATAERQLDAIVGWQAATERTLQLWERHATETEARAVAWQATTERTLQRLAESQVLLAESQAAADRRLQALAELLEKFLRGSQGDGHTMP